ncbi:MAG: 30S ribosomal protein S6 [Chitinispirillales bacterium]|nr:30S ribosomal protein S6 [Chitinispirillales bacterium]
MIRPYETTVVIDGTLPDDAVEKEQQALEDFFKSSAEVEKIDVWGKRQLAYTINKKRMGHYVVYYYRGEGTVPAAFEKHVKLNERVLRHLTVVRDLKNEAAREAFAARKEEVKVEKPGEDGDDDSETHSYHADRED